MQRALQKYHVLHFCLESDSKYLFMLLQRLIAVLRNNNLKTTVLHLIFWCIAIPTHR